MRRRTSRRSTLNPLLVRVSLVLLVFVLPGTLLAQSASNGSLGTGGDRTLQAEARRLTSAVQNASSRFGATGKGRHELVRLSNRRRVVLQALIVEHPEQVARLILPAGARGTLQRIAGAWAEPRVTMRGRYRVLAVDGESLGAFDQLVSEDGRSVFTMRGASTKLGLRPNDEIEATGYRLGNQLLTTPGEVRTARTSPGVRSLTAAAITASTATVGDLKVAVIVGTFSDSESTVDLGPIRTTFNGAPGTDVASFFAESSYGRMTVTPSFFGPYTLSSTASAGCSSRPTQALLDAAAADMTYAQFTRLVFVFNCPSSSFGSATNVGPVSTSQGTLQAAQVVLDGKSGADHWSVAHELSHTLGDFNGHAGLYVCLPDAFTPPSRFSEGCASAEYGDAFDTLGGPPTGTSPQLNPVHKARSGWFGAGDYPTVTASGSFTLSPYEQPSPNGQPLALNIPRGQSGTSFTVEYRQPLGFDAWMASPSSCPACTVTQGASIRLVTSGAGSGGGSDTQLIDTTPGTVPSSAFYPIEDGRDGALLPGRTFTDPEYGITITTVSADASGLTVLVSVPAQTCVHGTPAVSAPSLAAQTGTAGTASVYTVTVTNTDSAGCGPNTLRYLPGSNSSITTVADPDYLTLAPGASTNVSLRVAALPLTTTGTYVSGGVFRSSSLGMGDAAVAGHSYTLTSATDATAPAAASGVTATALGSSAAALSWTAATDNVGVVGYRITRSGAILTTPDTAIVDSGLSAGGSYTYSVQAFDRRGNLSPAATVSVTTPARADTSPPTPPTVTATAGDHTLAVSWTKSSDDVGVAYYRITPCLVPQCIVPASVRFFTVEGLPSRTRYDLQVVAVDGDGNLSSFGMGLYPVQTAAAGTTAPSQPTRLISPSGGYHHIELSWSSSTDDRGVASYAVFRSNRQIATVTGTSYTDTLAGAPSQYYVQAIDADGSLSAPSARVWFPAPYTAAADSTAPTATVTSLASGDTVSGTVDVTASASDDIKVTNVQLYVDGAMLTYKMAAPYTFTWNTTALANGTHWLYARAYDAAGNYGTVAVTSVTVVNAGNSDETPPSVAIETPSSGGTVSGAVTIDANAADNVGVTKVVIAVDGSTVATDTSPPYTADWNAAVAPAGTHMISATAYDAAGNTERASVQVTRPVPADATPPTVAIIAPASGATVTGTIDVKASASDNTGVTKVEFAVDAVVVSTAASSPYSLSWSATAAGPGAHVVTAKAFDAAGNTATATITVDVAADTTAPKVPSNLKALVVGTTQLTLSWIASTDNVGVEAYEIYRDSIQVGETRLPNFLDTGLVPGSSHKYTVKARDAAGNRSLLTSAMSTRQVAPSTSTTGTIAGVVYNALGRPAANVIVTLTGPGLTKTAKTGSAGTYKFSSLPAGSYSVQTGVGTTLTSVVGGVTLVLVSP